MLTVIKLLQYKKTIQTITPIKREAIFISNNYKKAEKEYVKTQTTYAILSKKYDIPLNKLSSYAKENKWVEKRKRYLSKNKKDELDITKLSNSQENLEKIIESAFYNAANTTSDDGTVDVKYLKDLTSTLKEAVNIKRNIYLLPILEAQKKREQELRDNPPAPNVQTNEICILLESDAEKYSV